MNTQTNPNLGRVAVHSRPIQHGKPRQQQSQPQQQAPPRQEKRVNDHGGFDSLLVGQRCRIKDGTGEVIEGIVSAASKFWYLVNADGQIIVINKAWTVSITPVQSPTNNHQNNADGASQNAEGQSSRSK